MTLRWSGYKSVFSLHAYPGGTIPIWPGSCRSGTGTTSLLAHRRVGRCRHRAVCIGVGRARDEPLQVVIAAYEASLTR